MYSFKLKVEAFIYVSYIIQEEIDVNNIVSNQFWISGIPETWITTSIQLQAIFMFFQIFLLLIY